MRFQYPPRIEPRFNRLPEAHGVGYPNFQYPPRIEPRFNAFVRPEHALAEHFQYPPRIEPRFNHYSAQCHKLLPPLSVSSSDRTSLQLARHDAIQDERHTFSILLGSNLASTRFAQQHIEQLLIFQYPPRIEPRFNEGLQNRLLVIEHFQYPPRIEPRFNK